jgi:hypothetical protein
MDKPELTIIGTWVGLICICVIAAGCINEAIETPAEPGERGLAPQGDVRTGRPGQNLRRGPPQESVDACKGKQINETCEFTLGGNTQTGTCLGRAGDKLSCFRLRGQDGQGLIRIILPQMEGACAQKNQKETCEFKFNDTLITGSCQARGSGARVCIPTNMSQVRLWDNHTGRGGNMPNPQQQVEPAEDITEDQ